MLEILGAVKSRTLKITVSVYVEPLEPLFDHLVHDAMYIVFV